MNVTTESSFPGIVDRVLHLNKRERAALASAAAILAEMRELAGTETELGDDLGKGEVVLRDYADAEALVLATATGVITL